MSKAIITGITGQDGSYLADFLLSQNYEVVGITRRTSTDNTSRISHLKENPNLVIESGDITDYSSIVRVLQKHSDATEFYNLAAQSHVGDSFKQPGLTWDITGKGCLNILQAIVDLSLQDKIKFYQASSSEMFGASYDESEGVSFNEPERGIQRFKFQNENTKFLPQSPYAISKCAAHYAVRLYREAYGLHGSCGVLFNHETLSYGTPLIVNIDGIIDILPIGDIARFKTGVAFDMQRKEYQEGRPVTNIKVWDQSGWVDVTWVSGYPHNGDKSPRIVNSRNSVYTATGSHPCIMEDGSEKNTSQLKIGDRVKLIKYPELDRTSEVSLEEAEWLGMLVGDGSLNKKNPRLTNKSMELKERFADLWMSFTPDGRYKFRSSISGFNGGEIGQLECYGGGPKDYDIYTDDISPFGHKNKKVPQKILNSSVDCMEAFLVGYNACDGLKSGYGKYRFRNFKTNSPTLAAGLLFLVSKVTGQKYNLTVEESWKHGKQQFYYSINLLSDRVHPKKKYIRVKSLLDSGMSQRETHRNTGISRSFIKKVKRGYIPENIHHLELCNNEVKKIIDIPNYDGWFFDLETSSGTFHAGVGQGVVHNSPRRGETFVTRKITKWIGEYIKWLDGCEFGTRGIFLPEDNDFVTTHGKPLTKPEFPKLRLGNLEASRDWGSAIDYIKAMHLMLQQDKPDDYVVCTGETHTIREFLDVAFSFIGISDWSEYVVIDPQFYRPAEVDYLRGDSSKIRKLGWKPETSFKELVRMMVEHDVKNAKKL